MEGSLVIAKQKSNFGLKSEYVDLLPREQTGRVAISLADLEAMRVDASTVPASKHSLETICGASCDIGAQ